MQVNRRETQKTKKIMVYREETRMLIKLQNMEQQKQMRIISGEVDIKTEERRKALKMGKC